MRVAGAAACAALAFTVDASASIVLPVRGLGAEVSHVQRIRPALERCAADSLAREPGPAAGALRESKARAAAYKLLVAPNGEVARVDVTPDGPSDAAELACFRAALGRLSFDPPDGGGLELDGWLLFGADATDDKRPIPIGAARPDNLVFATQLPAIVLHARATPPEGMAIDAAVGAARGCADDDATELRVRMRVAPSGARRDVSVTSSRAGVAACVERALTSPTRTGAGPLVEVDVTLAITSRRVRVVR